LKVLVTGLSGLLGKAIYYEGKKFFEIFGTSFKKVFEYGDLRSFRVDVRDRKSIEDLVVSIKPDLIIHAAAVTDVDSCEREKGYAYDVNVNGSNNILDAARKSSSKLVYISSDYIFDGRVGCYKEDDVPNPVNYYGWTKLRGEMLSLEYDKSLAVRASIYGFNPNGTREGLESIIEKVRRGLLIEAPYNMYNSIVSANTLSRIVCRLILENANGVYNIGLRQRISRYDFMEKFFSTFGLPKGSLVPVSYEDYQAGKIAIRPRDVSLNTDKLVADFGIVVPTIDEDLSNLRETASSYFACFGGEWDACKYL